MFFIMAFSDVRELDPMKSEVISLLKLMKNVSNEFNKGFLCTHCVLGIHQ